MSIKDNDIIERKPYLTNMEMVEYCQSLKNALVECNTRKKRPTSPKYDVLARLDRSIEYYSNMPTKSSFQYRDYQKEIINKATDLIFRYGWVYLAMEVRTGKTFTALGVCSNIKAKNVLFITKKKAMSSIEKDYAVLNPDYYLEVVNFESAHKILDIQYDVVVVDEAHSLGAFPKPSERTKLIRDIVHKNRSKVILMSGTPTPESFSQIYHQVYFIPKNPFSEHKSFYKFANEYIDVKQKKINSLMINDYKAGKDSIMKAMKPYMIEFSQQEAGFESTITESILHVNISPSVQDIINRLKKNLVVEGKDEVILGDTPVKLMMKIHQLCSGTIKFESGKTMVLDTSKAEFIKERFKGQKIGIFYKFVAELDAIKQVFGDQITTDLEEFNSTDKSIALQIVSGREGISLKEAQSLVYYNIDFSATSYWQSRDRMTTKERMHNNIYWIFSDFKESIEPRIYKAVSNKKDYTVQYFKRQYMKDNHGDTNQPTLF